MTKKHFIAIAEIIRRAIQVSDAEGPLLEVAAELADYFQTENTQFNRTRFLEACAGTGTVKTK